MFDYTPGLCRPVKDNLTWCDYHPTRVLTSLRIVNTMGYRRPVPLNRSLLVLWSSSDRLMGPQKIDLSFLFSQEEKDHRFDMSTFMVSADTSTAEFVYFFQNVNTFSYFDRNYLFSTLYL